MTPYQRKVHKVKITDKKYDTLILHTSAYIDKHVNELFNYFINYDTNFTILQYDQWRSYTRRFGHALFTNKFIYQKRM